MAKKVQEITGDVAPVLTAEQVFGIEYPEEGYVPTDPFGDSEEILIPREINIEQFLNEVADEVGLRRDELDYAMFQENLEEPLSPSSPAKMFISAKGKDVLSPKGLDEVLEKHTPASKAEPVLEQTTSERPPEVNVLVARLAAGETLTTKEISLLLASLIA